MSGKHHHTPSGNELILPLDFDLERQESAVRRLASGLVLFIVFAFGVMAVAPVREVAVAPGEIKPAGAIAEVRHVDGGEVGELRVSPGDVVDLGDPLVALRPSRVDADLRRISVRMAHLDLRRERLLALIEGREPDFRGDPALDAQAVSVEQALWASERRAFDRQVESLDIRRRQRMLEAQSRRREAESLREEIAAYADQLAMRNSLHERGVSSRAQLLEMRARVSEAQARLTAAEGAAESSETAAVEAKSESARVAAEKLAEWSGGYVEAVAETAELGQTLTKLQDQSTRLLIRSPIAGRVLDLGDLTAGGVLAAGGVAARVVPVDQELVAEARIALADVGHVAVGAEAAVTITTFDADEFGEWRGVVRSISPAAFDSGADERFFKAELALTHLGEGPTPALTAGMAVRADIRTGEKSILRYLLKPLFLTAELAFSER